MNWLFGDYEISLCREGPDNRLSYANWVYELKVCLADPRCPAHRTCIKFPSAAKMRGSHCTCARQPSPDHVTPPFPCFQRNKHSPFPPRPHPVPLSTIGHLYWWQPGLAYLFTFNSQKEWSQSEKAYIGQKQMITFKWKCRQEKHNEARRMWRNLHFVLWCLIYSLKAGCWFPAGFLATSVQR